MPRNTIEQNIRAVCTEIHSTVDICNGINKAQNKFFAPLVLIVQQAADAILACRDYSCLERMIQCARQVQMYNAGNCMLQSFLAFERLFKLFYSSSSESPFIPLAIVTTKDHAFLLIDNQWVCDPWKNEVALLDVSTQAGKRFNSYFSINENGECFQLGISDPESTAYLQSLRCSLDEGSSLNKQY